jgi:hypothetical protein
VPNSIGTDPFGTWFLGYGATVDAEIGGEIQPALGVGIQFTYQTGIFAHGRGGNIFNIRFCVCDAATFTLNTPGYVNIAAAGIGQFATFGENLTEGAGTSLGFGGAMQFARAEGVELNVDVDTNNNVTVSWGRLGPGVGLRLAVRFSGSCQGCSAYIWEVHKRVSKINQCVVDVINKIKEKLREIAGPPQVQPPTGKFGDLSASMATTAKPIKKAAFRFW